MTMTMKSSETQTSSSSGLFVQGSRQPVPLVGVVIAGEARGLLGEWKVTQRFRNTETKPIEATYLFPLPESATVCGLVIRTGERTLTAEIEDRDTAFQKYDEAMEKGDGAFLLDQERPNVFQMSVGNLLPGAEAVVEIRYLLLASPSGNRVRFMVPTTISPRYAPANLSVAEKTELERITPPYALGVPYGLTLRLNLQCAAKISTIESPSHPIRVNMSGKKACVELTQAETAMDRDVILEVETARPREASVFAGTWKDHSYLLLELYPEIVEETLRPKNVGFVIDCSGSMSGDSITEARRALELCLRGLNIGDRFQIIRFGDTFKPLFPEPLCFDQKTLERVVPLIQQIEADLGGTEILPALRSAAGARGETPLDLALLTDGQVSNEGDILAWAREQKAGLRIFSFGIGSGPSEYLINGLARATGGAAEFISPGERIEPKVLKQFARLSTPALDEVKLNWGHDGVVQAPTELPRIFADQVFLVAARLPANAALREGAGVTLEGRNGEQRFSWAAELSACENGEALALWWARQAIRDFEEQPETLRKGSNQHRGPGKIARLSKEFGILSSETSFVAIEERTLGQSATARAELRRVPVMITTGRHGVQEALAQIQSREVPAFLRFRAAPRSSAAAAPAPVSAARSGGGALSWLSEAVFGGAPTKARLSQKVMEADDECVDKAKVCRERSTDSFAPLEAPGSPPDEAAWIFELLQEMQADGSFRATTRLTSLVGVTPEQLRDWAGCLENAPEDQREALLATVLAVRLLRRRAAEHEEIWLLGVSKAERYLKQSGARGPGGKALADWLNELVPTPAHDDRSVEDISCEAMEYRKNQEKKPKRKHPGKA